MYYNNLVNIFVCQNIRILMHIRSIRSLEGCKNSSNFCLIYQTGLYYAGEAVNIHLI